MDEWVQKWTDQAKEIVRKLNDDTFDDTHQASGMNDAQLAIECLKNLTPKEGTEEIVLELLEELEASVGDDFYNEAVYWARAVNNEGLLEQIETIAKSNTDYVEEASQDMGADNSFSL